jgi:proliferating cell nuclear antigen
MDDCILYIQTVQSSALRTLVEVLKDVLNDINVVFDETGIKVMAMDGSRVALIHMRLQAENFEHFYCKQRFDAGLSLSALHKLMKTVSNSDTISLYVKDNNTNELCLNIENADRNCATTFRLKLLDIDNNELNIADVEINCIVTMPSNDFQRMCRDMANVGDNVEIVCENQTLIFRCNGDFAHQETVIGEATHGLNFSKNDEDTISGVFALKYINLFTKSTNLSNTIELYLKPDYPLILKYNVANLGSIKFCLAPKVE